MATLRDLPRRAQYHLQRKVQRWQDNFRVRRKALEIAAHAGTPQDMRPVVFFKASTGPCDFTYNNAFHVLAAWGLRLQGVPVVHFACRSGMSLCVMGTYPPKPATPPPCADCTAHSRALFAGADVRWFGYHRPADLAERIQDLPLAALMKYEIQPAGMNLDAPVPLGNLVTPGLRWILRRYHLKDDEPTRFILRQYLLSAWNVAREFAALLDRLHPQALVVFNGQFFPEAIAAWIARRRGMRVITHEVGLQPFSAFFTEGEATAYPIRIPDSFDLDQEQNARLDSYLEQRFQGQFSMAGIRFWPELKGLDETFLRRAGQFKQLVPVFTNVIFDTSQPHANTVFSDMFAWLELVLDLARRHGETFFVIRAHPDETRSGKESRETVQEWVSAHRVTELPNVLFIAPTEFLSSYELIRRSKFIMIYNSTIGLEASILGAAVLCAGRARFTQYPTVFFPQSVPEFRSMAEKFLEAESIPVPGEYRRNARRFLYYQLYRTSLPFEAYLTTGYHPSLTRLRDFSWEELLPQSSPAAAAILNGVLKNGDFLMKG
jgi:hypothetical protein